MLRVRILDSTSAIHQEHWAKELPLLENCPYPLILRPFSGGFDDLTLTAYKGGSGGSL